MNYSDILGEEHILNHFRNAVSYGKVSHAYIINGEDGSGKKTLARFFAKLLVCESPDKPCGFCHACKQAESGNHPDIKWITHEKPNTISVDDVRKQLNDDIVIKPYSSPYKIYIIDEAQKLGVAGQNAILKTIEEPPAYAVIIMLTNNAASFLPTVVSRCVMLNIRPLQKEQIISFLEEQEHVHSTSARMAAEFAGGNLGKAVKLATSEHFNDLKDNVLMIVKHGPDMQMQELIGLVKATEKFKMEIADYLNLLIMWYRDVLLYKATQQANDLIFKEEIGTISRQASTHSFNKIQEILAAIDKCKVRLNANVNYELALELMFEKIRSK